MLPAHDEQALRSITTAIRVLEIADSAPLDAEAKARVILATLAAERLYVVSMLSKSDNLASEPGLSLPNRAKGEM